LNLRLSNAVPFSKLTVQPIGGTTPVQESGLHLRLLN